MSLFTSIPCLLAFPVYFLCAALQRSLLVHPSGEGIMIGLLSGEEEEVRTETQRFFLDHFLCIIAALSFETLNHLSQ